MQKKKATKSAHWLSLGPFEMQTAASILAAFELFSPKGAGNDRYICIQTHTHNYHHKTNW